MAKINYYGKDISYADSSEIFEKTSAFIRNKLQPIDMVKKILPVTDKKLQFEGVDKILILESGAIRRLEEKIRRISYNDILIEIIADNRYASYDSSTNEFKCEAFRGEGWGMKTYQTDFLLYYFEDTNTGYLFSWQKFRKVLTEYLQYWYQQAEKNKNGFGLKIAHNKDYYSVNIAIPTHIFLSAYIYVGGRII